MSPLYIGAQPLSRQRLAVLEGRLRDVLVGDVVRGIEVGTDGGSDTTMGRAGALERVEMRWVRLASLLGQQPGDEHEHEQTDDNPQRPASRDLGIDAPSDFARGLWRRRRALHMSLQYENALCTAILMPSTSSSPDDSAAEAASQGYPSAGGLLFNTQSAPADDDEDDGHFLHLPLLLLRMPPPLKPVVLDFIATTFDCRTHPLRLGTRSLTQAWERWLRDAGAPPSRGPFAKDALVTLGFHAPSIIATADKDKGARGGGGEKQQHADEEDPEAEDENGATKGPLVGIRAVDVIVPAADIRRFAEAGKRARAERSDDDDDHPARRDHHDARKRRRLGGGADEEGWAWRGGEAGSASASASQPFTEALARYIDRHLALDMFHPAVRVTRVACGAFVLSEGRVKVFAPPAEEGAADGRQQQQPAFSRAQQQGIQGLISGLTDRARGKRVAYRL